MRVPNPVPVIDLLAVLLLIIFIRCHYNNMINTDRNNNVLLRTRARSLREYIINAISMIPLLIA